MRVVAAYEQPEQAEALRAALLGLGLECGAGDCVPFAELPLRLAQSPLNLLVVGVGRDAAAAFAAIRQAIGLTQAPVVAVGPTNDAQLILQATRSGAREYLDEARLQEDLESALEKLRLTGAVPGSKGLVVGVLSATPGGGVTTIATNLAFSWAEKYPGQVVLVELGRETAELALGLDLAPRHTVADLAENWQRMDAALLRHTVATHPDGVQVLAHAPDLLASPPLDPRAVRKAIILMRALYNVAVFDLGHAHGEEHWEALRLADRAVLVVRLDVPGVRQARRLARLCQELGVPRDRLRFIANRHGQKGQLAWKKAEEALGEKFVEFVPEDCASLNGALNQGRPLVKSAPRATISKTFAKMAVLLNGRNS